MDLPLLEDDLHSGEVIEPRSDVGGKAVIERAKMPSRVVFCFFTEVIDKIALREDARVVASFPWAHGEHRVLEIQHRGERLAVVHAGVGAPLAGGLLEQVIALGGQMFVAVGGRRVVSWTTW